MGFKIQETGGRAHYSEELRQYLWRLTPEEAARIVREIEWRARPRKIVIITNDPPEMQIGPMA